MNSNKIPTGVKQLNKKIKGWENGNLILVCGHSVVGKIAMSILPTVAAIKENYRVGFFSLKPSAKSFVNCLISSKIISKENENLFEDKKGNERKSFKIIEKPIYIKKLQNPSILVLGTKIRKLVYNKRLNLVIIDNWQFIQDTSKKKNASLFLFLKALAKDLNIPILLLSEPPESVQKDKTPRLSHLNKFGAIQQNLDVILLLYQAPESSSKNIEIRIAKHKKGTSSFFPLSEDI